ncbi:MFS transporter [Fortiea contorta]|uniref:MFS transporter n=1 Tax=Fortiea contorta TaxID=1892405 RepID=UPI000348CBFC|nr:MFS transporter [Fortiea contorta]
MTLPTRQTGMRTFMTVWFGQAVSLIGSSMTDFALTIWVWQLTGEATPLALLTFFTKLPQILFAPIAGVIVDRAPRKLLIILTDTVSAVMNITVLLLYLTQHLQMWHLYLIMAIKGTFEQFQTLAFSASISVIVPKQHYNRASSMGFLAGYGSNIVAPALASVLYLVIGIAGILMIDLTTFAIAIITVLLVQIPQPAIKSVELQTSTNIRQELSYGWHYIAARPSLLAMLVLASWFWFAHDIGAALYSPLILARTGNDAQILGSLASAAGIGGVIGALVVSSWGGNKRRINGVLIGMIGAGLSKIAFGLGRSPLIWIPTQFCSSLNFPFLGSYHNAIWLAKVKTQVQGRVFATRSVVELVTSSVAFLIAGLLADRIFEPAMLPNGSLSPFLGSIFGTDKGAGIALLYFISSLGLLIVGLSGYAVRNLRDLEMLLPDHDADNSQ